jgi:hypothetical protein
MSTDDKLAIQILSQISKRFGVGNLGLARSLNQIDDRTLLKAIFKDIAAQKNLESR